MGSPTPPDVSIQTEEDSAERGGASVGAQGVRAWRWGRFGAAACRTANDDARNSLSQLGVAPAQQCDARGTVVPRNRGKDRPRGRAAAHDREKDRGRGPVAVHDRVQRNVGPWCARTIAFKKKAGQCAGASWLGIEIPWHCARALWLGIEMPWCCAGASSLGTKFPGVVPVHHGWESKCPGVVPVHHGWE